MELTEKQKQTLETFFVKMEDDLLFIFNWNEEQGHDPMPSEVCAFYGEMIGAMDRFKIQVRRS